MSVVVEVEHEGAFPHVSRTVWLTVMRLRMTMWLTVRMSDSRSSEVETSEMRMPYERACLLRGGAAWMSRLGRLCRNVAVVELRD